MRRSCFFRSGFALSLVCMLAAACHRGPTPEAETVASPAVTLRPSRVLTSLPGSRGVVLGEVRRVARIDRHGYRAALEVIQPLSGPFAAEEVLELGWEELATGRAPRLQVGRRFLVVVEPLPRTTLWLNRVPAALRTDHFVAIAGAGEALLPEPAEPTVKAVVTYLTEPNRETPEGEAAALLRLVGSRAESGLLLEAIHLLREQADFIPREQGETTGILAGILRDTAQSPLIRIELLHLVEARRWQALKGVVEELLPSPGDLGLAALQARIALDPTLPKEAMTGLLRSFDPVRRAIGIRAFAASEESGSTELEALWGEERDESVRQAILETLARQRGRNAVPFLLKALGDESPTIRVASGTELAQLGPEIVPALLQGATTGSFLEVQGVILALDRLGSPGAAALQKLAVEHADERVRTLAQMALGRMPGDH